VLAATGGGGGSGLTWSSVPASATATGTAGSIAYDGSYFYIAPAANTWFRAPLSAWNWSPTAITGLQGWFDASDASTLYNATTGGSLVAADGAVARWQDKSGNNRHLTQGTSNKQPVRKASVVNSRDVLRFDGTSDSIAGALVNMTAFSFYIVFKRIGSASNAYSNVSWVVDLAVQDDTARRLMQLAYNDSIFSNSVRPGATGGSDLEAVRNNNFSIHSVIADVGSSHLYALNGSATTASNSAASFAGTPSLSIGNMIFNSAANEYYFNGDCAEVLIYNTAHSDTVRGVIESYLKTKYGIS
jgi:hypothetical protein